MGVDILDEQITFNEIIEYFEKIQRSNEINLSRAIKANRGEVEINNIKKKIKYYDEAIYCLTEKFYNSF